MPTPRARGRQRVTAVASLGERVRAETQPGFCFDDLVDHGFIVPFVEVVHELCAFVTKKSSVFEANRTFHGSHASETSSRTSDLLHHVIGRSNWPYSTNGIEVLQVCVDDFNDIDIIK